MKILSHQVIFLANKFYIKIGFTKSIILNVDNSEDVTMLIKLTNLN